MKKKHQYTLLNINTRKNVKETINCRLKQYSKKNIINTNPPSQTKISLNVTPCGVTMKFHNVAARVLCLLFVVVMLSCALILSWNTKVRWCWAIHHCSLIES